jgi:hypothetical protein
MSDRQSWFVRPAGGRHDCRRAGHLQLFCDARGVTAANREVPRPLYLDPAARLDLQVGNGARSAAILKRIVLISVFGVLATPRDASSLLRNGEGGPVKFRSPAPAARTPNAVQRACPRSHRTTSSMARRASAA